MDHTEKKPREFFVETHEGVGPENWPQVYYTNFPGTIHVIEHSAYLAKCEEAEGYKKLYDQCNADLSVMCQSSEQRFNKLKDLESRLEKAKAALRFYGDWKSYDWDESRGCMDHAKLINLRSDDSRIEYIENDGTQCKAFVGGKLARETIKELEGE